jgi:hypothetical protein
MKTRYRLIRRGVRNGSYCVDTKTGKRSSLRTDDEDAAIAKVFWLWRIPATPGDLANAPATALPEARHAVPRREASESSARKPQV